MRAPRRSGQCVAAMLLIMGSAALATPARADDAMNARQLVEEAKLTFESMIVAPEMDGLRDLMKNAKGGVFIAPRVLRGAFIFGVSGGSGVFFARGERRDSGPARPSTRLARRASACRPALTPPRSFSSRSRIAASQRS